VGVAVWGVKAVKGFSRNKPSLSISVIEEPTMCSSFDTGRIMLNEKLHRTAFLLYLKILNDGEVPIQIDKIHLGYKSEANDNTELWYWLKEETVLLEDYATPIGDSKKVIPFLKQKNHLIENNIENYLRPGEYKNGLVYFEQEESIGKKALPQNLWVNNWIKEF
jgi:hypothetical protein